MKNLLSWLTLVFLTCSEPSLAQSDARSSSSSPTSSQLPQIEIEMNKLEPVNGDCRGYFVVRNRHQDAVGELQLDTFLFDQSGLILRRVGLTFEQLRPERLKVVLFDFGVACSEIGRVHVNDVLACSGTNAAIADCAENLALSTRSSVPFE